MIYECVIKKKHVEYEQGHAGMRDKIAFSGAKIHETCGMEYSGCECNNKWARM